MPREHVIEIDPSKPLAEDPKTGHNRWHEAIEPVVEVDPGDTVIYETRDAVDGQLNPHSTVTDVGNLDLNPVHPLPEGILQDTFWTRGDEKRRKTSRVPNGPKRPH